MTRGLGLVVALTAEGRALLGAFGWVRAGGLAIRRTRLPDGTGLLCARSGVGAERALAAARWLAAEGVTALAVIGVSGGLDPGLRPGDLVVADAVLEAGEAAGGAWATDADRTGLVDRALAAEGLPVRRGAVISAGRPVASPQGKEALRDRCPALVVDMESAAVARAAAEGKVPLVVLRAVCDTADQSVPEDFLVSLDDDGSVRPSVLLRRLAGRPALVGDLVRMERGFSAAVTSLRCAWHVLLRAGLPARLAPG